MKAAAALVLLLFAAAAGACGRGASQPVPELAVAAASDLRYAFEELAPRFEAECGCRLRFTFGSSGMLAAQIEQGLPADLFFSADVGYVERLTRQGVAVPETVAVYSVGRIVLAVPARSGNRLERLEDLASPGIRAVAIPNPEHAPYGVAARQALQATGLWEALRPKLVLAENASQAVQFVESGEADAGIVPLSLAIRRGAALSYVLIDDELHAPLRQAAVVLAASRRPDVAAAFVRYIVSGAGREVMERYGFEAP